MKLIEMEVKAIDLRMKNHIAQCMGQDCVMPKDVTEVFPKMQEELKYHVLNSSRRKARVYPTTIIHQSDDMENAVFNIITKDKFFNTTNISDFRKALEETRLMCERLGVEEIALQIPSDMSEVDVVTTLKEVFKNYNIKIILCYGEGVN